MINHFDKGMYHLFWIGVWVYAIGSFTSMSIITSMHFFMAIPCLYFLYKTPFERIKKIMTPSMWALLVMILVMILSVIFNHEIIERPLRHISRTRYFVVGLLSVFVFYHAFEKFLTTSKLKWLLAMLLFSACFATLFSFIGFWGGYNYIRMSEADPLRNEGLFNNLMTYAYLLSLFLIPLFAVLNKWKEPSFAWSRLFNYKFLVFAFLFNLLALYLTYTRGAWLGLIIGIPFLFFKSNKKMFFSFLAAFALFTSLLVGFSESVQRGITRSGDDSRLAYWQTAIAAAKERPIFGYGYRNFESNVIEIKSRHPEIGWPELSGHAHSNFFEMLGSTGIFGALSFVLFTIIWAAQMYRRDDMMGQVVFAMIISFTVSGMVQFTLGDAPITAFMMLVFAISQLPSSTLERMLK